MSEARTGLLGRPWIASSERMRVHDLKVVAGLYVCTPGYPESGEYGESRESRTVSISPSVDA
jgi:hypothetical protein